MKKKIVVFCIFAVMLLVTLPVLSSAAAEKEQQLVRFANSELHNDEATGTFDSPLLTGYILINVMTWTPGVGIHPYEGANISVKGLFYSYSGETDESGDCLFKVRTNLFRPKNYHMKVSIPPGNWFHTRRTSFFIMPRQIAFKEFLFIVL